MSSSSLSLVSFSFTFFPRLHSLLGSAKALTTTFFFYNINPARLKMTLIVSLNVKLRAALQGKWGASTYCHKPGASRHRRQRTPCACLRDASGFDKTALFYTLGTRAGCIAKCSGSVKTHCMHLITSIRERNEKRANPSIPERTYKND